PARRPAAWSLFSHADRDRALCESSSERAPQEGHLNPYSCRNSLFAIQGYPDYYLVHDFCETIENSIVTFESHCRFSPADNDSDVPCQQWFLRYSWQHTMAASGTDQRFAGPVSNKRFGKGTRSFRTLDGTQRNFLSIDW